MEIPAFIRGIVIGFSIAAPVGPIGILCIRRTLANGMLSGLISGLGAATADAFYACLAALGLTVFISVILDQRGWLQMVGGIYLCYLGVKTFLETPVTSDKTITLEGTTTPGKGGLLKARSIDYFSTLFLTITNPLTILSFVAIFAGFGFSSQGSGNDQGLILVAGVFIGSCTWWLLLSLLTNAFRIRFLTASVLRWINRLSGMLIVAFGLLALGTLLLK